ncbi:MAG: hypothetical protein ABSH28_04750 [Acidobacteriota bacterium]
MTMTHGGRAKLFSWFFGADHVLIENEDHLRHTFSVEEIFSILSCIQTEFARRWFPLANNVEKMYRRTERPGLGTTIHQMRPGDTLHAQGASYLGVVLEEIGILEWNGRPRGISWRLINHPGDLSTLRALLPKHASSPV